MSLVRFNADGSLEFIYRDGHPVLEIGRPSTRRASHVEPTEDGHWQVDMGPVGGPRLAPTRYREEALVLELEWIELWMEERRP